MSPHRATRPSRRPMSSSLTTLALGVAVLSGCATAPPAFDPLGRADEEMAAARYRDAVRLYEEFLRANPEHPAAVRARAAQAALDRLLAAQTEIERLKAELASRDGQVAQLRQDLSARRAEGTTREAELGRLRRDLAARQGEVDRLKADLERLRSIDLRRDQPRR